MWYVLVGYFVSMVCWNEICQMASSAIQELLLAWLNGTVDTEKITVYQPCDSSLCLYLWAPTSGVLTFICTATLRDTCFEVNTICRCSVVSRDRSLKYETDKSLSVQSFIPTTISVPGHNQIWKFGIQHIPSLGTVDFIICIKSFFFFPFFSSSAVTDSMPTHLSNLIQTPVPEVDFIACAKCYLLSVVSACTDIRGQPTVEPVLPVSGDGIMAV